MRKKNKYKVSDVQDEIIEQRELNVSFGKNGQGTTTTRLAIPKKFFEKIGISEENRKVYVKLYQDRITIRKV